MKITLEKHGFYSNINGYYDVGRQLPDYLLRKAEGCVKQEIAAKEQITKTSKFEIRREALRKTFIDAIGGLPSERTPLNAVVTKSVDFEQVQIRNVIFESRPQMYVTANLYVPHHLTGPAPAVLMACGHANEGKASVAYQRVAMDLASNGIIVFLVDPIGQGERLQYDKWDENGNYLVGRTSREHTYLGQQCVLTGSSLAQYMIWDLMRAIDYLETLDIVDHTRIGMTGNSGGGTQTAYMMLCEKRLVAAMPCCFTTSRLDYMKTGQVQDLEQIIFNVISNGINFDDLITALAPKPIRIGAARYDFFCPEGAEKTYEQAKKIYSLYLAQSETTADNIDDLVSIVFADATHGYSTQLRQGAVNFFRRTLLGLEESFIADPNRPVLPEEMLWATKTGNIIKEFSEIKTPWHFNMERLTQIRYADTSDKQELRKRVERLLQIPASLTDRPEIKYPRIISDFTEDWSDMENCSGDASTKRIRIRKIFFFSEEDIICTGVLYDNAETPSTHCTVYVSNDSTSEMEEHQADIHKLLEKGAVFVFDPRGTGSAASRTVYPAVHTTSMGTVFDNYYKLNCDAQMLGTSLYALRVYDILRAWDLMTGFFTYTAITLAGRDFGAVDILTAAVLLDDVDTIVFGETISFEALVNTQYYSIYPRNNIHGLLAEYDVPLLKNVLHTITYTDA